MVYSALNEIVKRYHLERSTCLPAVRKHLCIGWTDSSYGRSDKARSFVMQSEAKHSLRCIHLIAKNDLFR